MLHNTLCCPLQLFYPIVDSFSDLINASVFISLDRFKVVHLSSFFTIKKPCLHSKVRDMTVAWDY